METSTNTVEASTVISTSSSKKFHIEGSKSPSPWRPLGSSFLFDSKTAALRSRELPQVVPSSQKSIYDDNYQNHSTFSKSLISFYLSLCLVDLNFKLFFPKNFSKFNLAFFILFWQI